MKSNLALLKLTFLKQVLYCTFSNPCSFQVKVVTGKDGQAVTPVAIATQLPANVSAAFSVQQPFQVIHATLVLKSHSTVNVCVCAYILDFFFILYCIGNVI